MIGFYSYPYIESTQPMPWRSGARQKSKHQKWKELKRSGKKKR